MSNVNLIENQSHSIFEFYHLICILAHGMQGHCDIFYDVASPIRAQTHH